MQFNLLQNKIEGVVPLPINPIEQASTQCSDLDLPASRDLQATKAHHALIQRFRSLKHSIKRFPRINFIAVCSLIFIPTGLDRLNARGIGWQYLDLLANGSLLCYLTLAVYHFPRQFAAVRRIKQTAIELAESEKVESIGPLLEALFLCEPVHSMAVSALQRLVPQATLANQHTLSRVHQKIIYDAIKKCSNRRIFWKYNPQIAIVLIDLIGNINDMESIPMLTNLRARMGNEPDQRRIRESIKSCWERLTPDIKPGISINSSENISVHSTNDPSESGLIIKSQKIPKMMHC